MCSITEFEDAFDTSGRLTATGLKNSASTILNQHSYLNNQGNQRSKQTRTDLSSVNYTYDDLGELRSALGYTSGGTPITTEQKGYAYDAAWNLNYRTNNGAVTTFGVNAKNELTSFSSNTFTYDNNGNMTYYGVSGGWQRYFTYDDEDQLASVQVPGYFYSLFTYDGLGRLRQRLDYSWNGTSWVSSATKRCLYDGRCVIQERDGSNNPTVSYTRGSDLSGTREGAGGIGGMLARSHGYSAGTWSTHHFYHADGNGNITAMADSSQLISASYKYDSYGYLLTYMLPTELPS